jgi:hypothetical protein
LSIGIIRVKNALGAQAKQRMDQDADTLLFTNLLLESSHRLEHAMWFFSKKKSLVQTEQSQIVILIRT